MEKLQVFEKLFFNRLAFGRVSGGIGLRRSNGSLFPFGEVPQGLFEAEIDPQIVVFRSQSVPESIRSGTKVRETDWIRPGISENVRFLHFCVIGGEDIMILYYHVDQIYKLKHGLDCPPIQVEVSPTSICQQECRFCYTFQRKIFFINCFV